MVPLGMVVLGLVGLGLVQVPKNLVRTSAHLITLLQKLKIFKSLPAERCPKINMYSTYRRM